MATYLNVQRAHRFIQVLRQINRRYIDVSTEVSKLASNYDNLSAPDQTEVNAVLVELGYTLADLNSLYTELKDGKTWIDANITEMQEPLF